MRPRIAEQFCPRDGCGGVVQIFRHVLVDEA